MAEITLHYTVFTDIHGFVKLDMTSQLCSTVVTKNKYQQSNLSYVATYTYIVILISE